MVGMFSNKFPSRSSGLLLLAALFFMALAPEHALAADIDLRGSTAAIGDVVSKIISALNMLIWIVFIFLNYLLDPNFIFDLNNAQQIGTAGSEGAFMGMLNQIWQLSRDIVNVCFAVALLFSSIYTVFTAKRELLQQYAPKFIMAVVLVNFSWFIPRMVLDVANIGASTVYSVPSVLNSKCSVPSEKLLTGRNCADTDGDGTYSCDCVIVVDAKMFLSEAEFNGLNKVSNGSPGWKCPLDTVMCVRMELLTNNVAGHAAILNGLVINQARLEFLAQVPKSPGGANSPSRLIIFVIRSLLILVIHVALFFPLLAMMIAFAIRIPVLWITMAFMPFAFLGMVVDEKFTFGLPKEITDHFVKAAFLPAIVGVPLTIGFILVNAGTTVGHAGLSGLEVRLLDNVANFWELLWLAIALGVLYTGVFAALQKIGGVLATGAESIKQFGNAAGRVALKAPLALPILPGGQTPLFLAKQFNPRNIEAAISGPQGFKDFRNRLAGAAGKDVENRKAAADIARNNAQMHDLGTKIAELKIALKDPDKSKSEKVIADIKSQFKIDIDGGSLDNDLTKLVQDLKENKGDTLNPSDFQDIERTVKDIKDDLKNKPANP